MYTEYEDSHQTGRQRKRKSKKGLHGAESKGSPKNTGMELSKPLLVVGGLLVGNLAGKAVDKFIPVNADEKGFMKIIKSSVKPLVQGGLGVGVILLSRERENDTKNAKVIKELARSLGYGVAGSSVVSVVKLVNKDLFAGLGDTGTKPIEAKYYREAKDEIMKMLQDNSFKPALPEPSMQSVPETPHAEAIEVSGFGEAEQDNEIL